jgi:MFS transporter, ACDE family, multidrug resistance protein
VTAGDTVSASPFRQPNLALMSAGLLVIAVFTSSQLVLIVAVIVSGAFVGLNNTLTTQAVMLVAPVDKPVASAAYGFVRFIGGGLAPFAASKLAADLNVHVPFYLGAATVAAAIGVLATGDSLLDRAEHRGAQVSAPAGATEAAAASAAEAVPAGEPAP